VQPFKNEPILDFSLPDNRNRITRSLETLIGDPPEEVPLLIGGKEVTTDRWISSLDPGETNRILGRVAQAGPAEAEQAIRAAEEAFPRWSRTPPEERADILLRTAEILRRRRFEIDALMMLEAGKTRQEADGDLAEAIDFLEYYAREMIRYARGQPLAKLPGEENSFFYVPLGAGSVITPWNFPLAIPTGMISAAMVTGNTVIFKSCLETPLTAYRLVQALQEAGLPAGVVSYLPGDGPDTGEFLVRHPRTRFISFTGSKEVGQRITELAGKTVPGQRWIKRVIAEMGGKDAIIVDEDADLDEATEGIVTSAFGFQGQKCSACSRVIALESIYRDLINRVAERASQLRVGRVEDSETHLGPVISEEALQKILKYIEIGKGEGSLLTGGARARGKGLESGYFIQPTVFGDIAPEARIAQEEIFGPVLAMIPARNFDEAISIANGTEYGLTGAVYSRNREHLERARWEFHVGNLYFNRKCTAAMVGVHPFGGFNMSGTDSKAGGPDYLLLFLQAKLVSERIQPGRKAGT